MRKINAVLTVLILILFLLHGVAGAFQLFGAGSNTLKILGWIMGQSAGGADRKRAILTSLKPYLKPERRAELDRAAEIARLVRIARAALTEFAGGDGHV